MKKIKSFTLSEMLVVLVVSSIVISLAFVVLSMVKKQVTNIQGNFYKKEQIQDLERLLLRDINSYHTEYIASSDEILLTNTIDTIRYTFKKEFILRKTDTIKINIASKKLFLDGNPIKEGTFDAIQLNFSEQYANHQVFSYKIKDASFYINN